VRRMTPLLLALLAVALAAPLGAAAHPLGNFTVNRFSRIEVSGHRLYVRYVLDMAEIPTFQAQQSDSIDAASYSRRIAAEAHMAVNGQAVRLMPLRYALAFPKGTGGLQTTRLEVILAGPRLAGPSRITYRDTNYADRIGWREVVVGATTPSRSDELRAYPKDLLSNPLEISSAAATLAPTARPSAPPALDRGPALQAPDRVVDHGFASLVSKEQLSIGFVLLSLAIAFFWGAAHALSPGHGKSIVAAYLVGARGTPRHACLLGLTVTVTHTIGVFALGLVTLSLSAFIVPDQLYPWLNLVSALLIVSVGVSVLRWRIREWRRGSAERHHQHHHHAHDHHHHGDHDHHDYDPALSLKRLLGVGVSGGIIPCPTALVVLLAAISLHRIGYGLVLILAFSLGLASALSGVGLLAVSAKRLFGRLDLERGAVRLLPAASALGVLGLGLAMTIRALPKVT
jgi:nickel/cobalt transporter (NicO) family protein